MASHDDVTNTADKTNRDGTVSLGWSNFGSVVGSLFGAAIGGYYGGIFGAGTGGVVGYYGGGWALGAAAEVGKEAARDGGCVSFIGGGLHI